MTCPVTVWPATFSNGARRFSRARCDQPLQRGALYCAAHEADRLRLTTTSSPSTTTEENTHR